MEELKKDVESAKILGTHAAAHHHSAVHHHANVAAAAAAAAAHHHHHKAFMDLNLLQKKADEYNQAIAAGGATD